jgi:hypothetical protein
VSSSSTDVQSASPGLEARARRGLAAALFAAVLTTNLFLFSATIRSWDGGAMLAVTRSLALEGGFHIPEGQGRVGRDGRLYAWYGPACSVAALPLFALGHGVAQAAGWGPERTQLLEEAAVSLFNPLVVAATAALLFLTALRLRVRPPWAAGGALLYAFATGAFVQMKDFNSEPFSALLLLWAFYALLLYRDDPRPRWLGLAGAAGGVALLTRVANLSALVVLAIGAAVWVCACRPRQAGRSLASFLAPVAAGGVLYALFNYARFGDPLATGYPEIAFDWLPVEGLWFQLFSLERGLCWYNPLLLLAPVGVGLWWRRQRTEALLLLGWALAVILLYASYLASPEGGGRA